MKIKQMIFNKRTMIEVMLALIYQLIMAAVYIPAYNNFQNHINHTKISLVNQDDSKAGRTLADKIKHQIEGKSRPEIKTSSLKVAKNDLSAQRSMGIIKINANTVQRIAQGKAVNLTFYNNRYIDQTSNQIFDKIKSSLINNLNQHSVQLGNLKVMTTIMMDTQGKAIVADKLSQIVHANPSFLQNKVLYQQTKNKIIQAVTHQMVIKAKQVAIQPVMHPQNVNINRGKGGIGITLSTMFLSLGCFISVMTASMIIIKEIEKMIKRRQLSKFKGITYYELAMLLIAITSPLLSVVIFSMFAQMPMATACMIYLQNVLLTFVSGQVVSVATFLFSQVGLLINLAMALIQVVVSGSIMSYKLLPLIYQVSYSLLPLPYSYAASINILSGTNVHLILFNDSMVTLIGVVTFMIAVLIVHFKKYNHPTRTTIEEQQII